MLPEEAAQAGPAPVQVTVIRARRGWIPINFPELWEYRELFVFMVWRSIRVRYAQTILGIAWAIIQPLFTMLVFTVIFHKLGNISSGSADYRLFSFSGLVPWTLFATGMAQSSNSLVGSSNLLKKIYFPRAIIPASAVLSAVVDFSLAFLVLMGMMPIFGQPLTLRLLLTPLFVAIAMCASLGVGLWLSAMNVQFRDVKHTIPFLTQFLLLATPIGWGLDELPQNVSRYRSLMGVNPMAGVVEGFRWAVLGQGELPIELVAISAATAGVLLVSGAIYFRRMERTFADIV